MDTLVNDGTSLLLLNSTGGDIAVNTPVVVGNLIAITRDDIADTESGTVTIVGRHRLAKNPTVAFVQGDRLYWDSSATGELTTVSTGNAYAGTCAEDADTADTAADILINKVERLVHNLDATTAPGVTNDIDEGYTVGSRWIDLTAAHEYVCLDNTDGAAVWKQTTV